jgi:hypothetical protein
MAATASAAVTALTTAIAAKTERQSPRAACSTAPPSENPTAAAAPAKAAMTPKDLGKLAPERCSPTIATLSEPAANPGATTIRPMSSVVASGAIVLTSEPAHRQPIATTMSRRCPSMEPSAGNSAALTVPETIVAIRIQPSVEPDAFSEVPICPSIVKTRLNK